DDTSGSAAPRCRETAYGRRGFSQPSDIRVAAGFRREGTRLARRRRQWTGRQLSLSRPAARRGLNRHEAEERRMAKAREKVVTVLHTVEFDAPVKAIFDLYANARQHAKVIGAPVEFQRRVGGRFSAWGGSVRGVNVVLESPALITQAW